MTTHKAEEMITRLEPQLGTFDDFTRRLAEVLCEMEERKEAWNPAYGDKEADKEHLYEDGYKAGYLAALEEARAKIKNKPWAKYFDYMDVQKILDDLKKKYE